MTCSITLRMLTAQGEPHVSQRLGGTVVVDGLGSFTPDGGQRAVDGAQDVGEGDGGGGAGQPVAALGAALALHQAALTEQQQDVLQEAGRDVLGGGQFTDGAGAPACLGQLGKGPDGVLAPG